MHIFVVDDDPYYADILMHQIRMTGDHVVKIFHKAKDVVSALRAGETCGLLIIDIFMEDMDGVELIMHLSDVIYSGAISIISGVSSETLNIAESIARNSGLNVCGAHVKPITAEQLYQCITAAQAAIHKNS